MPGVLADPFTFDGPCSKSIALTLRAIMNKPKPTPMLGMLMLSLALVGAVACTAALAQTRSASAASNKDEPPAQHGLSTEHQRMFCGDPDSDIGRALSMAVSAEIDAILAHATGSAQSVGAALDQIRRRYCSPPARSAT